MPYQDTKPEICEDSKPYFSLLKIFGIVFALAFIAQFLSLGVIRVMGFSDDEFFKALEHPFNHPNLKNAIMIAQAISSIGLFIIAPLIYLYIIEKKSFKSLSVPHRISIISIGLAALIVITFMAFDALIIEWNQNIDLPEFLSGFERWLKAKEESLKVLTEYLTAFDSHLDFVVAFIVVAVIPGIGEELLFRGLIQNKLLAGTKNIHVAIWVTALAFSLFHFQFYGLIPRMLLGALFGYMYYWSGNILIPMIAHFVNNGFTVVALYLYRLKYLDYNIEETTSVPIATAVTGLLITATLLFSFWKYYSGKRLLQ